MAAMGVVRRDQGVVRVGVDEAGVMNKMELEDVVRRCGYHVVRAVQDGVVGDIVWNK